MDNQHTNEKNLAELSVLKKRQLGEEGGRCGDWCGKGEL